MTLLHFVNCLFHWFKTWWHTPIDTRSTSIRHADSLLLTETHSNRRHTPHPSLHTRVLLFVRRHTPTDVNPTHGSFGTTHVHSTYSLDLTHGSFFLFFSRSDTRILLSSQRHTPNLQSARSRSLDKPFGTRRSNRHFFFFVCSDTHRGTTHVRHQTDRFFLSGDRRLC